MNGTLDKRSEGAFYFKGMLDIGQNTSTKTPHLDTNIASLTINKYHQHLSNSTAAYLWPHVYAGGSQHQ